MSAKCISCIEASYTNQEFGAGDESLEVNLVSLDRIPWDQLAFPVIHEILSHYVVDRKQHSFGVHFGAIAPMEQNPK